MTRILAGLLFALLFGLMFIYFGRHPFRRNHEMNSYSPRLPGRQIEPGRHGLSIRCDCVPSVEGV
jgi:hypothetical protein